MCRFVRESLRFAHRSAPGHPDLTAPDRDVVRPFVRPGWKSPPRKSDAIFGEPMGSSYTHQEHFTRGVDEHPHFGSRPRGTLGASAEGGSYAVFHMSKQDFRVGRDL